MKILLPVIRPIFFLHIVNMNFKSTKLIFIIKLLHFSNSISEIESNQYEVANLMKQLKKPPKKYEEAYSVLKVYYDNYLKMTKIVTSPTGSLNTFSEDFNTYDNNTVDSYEKMKLYLD